MKKEEKMPKTAQSGKKTKKRGNRKARWTRGDTELTLLGLPTFLWFVVFAYLPMFGMIIAFKNYKISAGHGFLYSLFHSEWAGFGNFNFFFKSNAFPMLLRNTVLYNIVFIILGTVIPITLAIVISQLYSKLMSKVYQTMMFFPHFMSWVVVSYFVYAFLNPTKGLLNQIVGLFGGDPVMWYSEAKYWPFILVFMNLWKGTGYGMVVYLATITGIDSSMYEAAMIDGATKFQQAKYITLPCLRPMAIMMFIMNVGKIFYSDFGLFYQVTQRVPNALYNTVSTFDTYLYNALQSNVSIGRTAAASLFQSVACCITILAANYIVSKIDSESALI